MNSRRRISIPRADQRSLPRGRFQGNGSPFVFAALHESGCGPVSSVVGTLRVRKLSKGKLPDHRGGVSVTSEVMPVIRASVGENRSIADFTS